MELARKTIGDPSSVKDSNAADLDGFRFQPFKPSRPKFLRFRNSVRRNQMPIPAFKADASVRLPHLKNS